MPGLLSSIFDGGGGDTGSSAQTVATGNSIDLALSPDVVVETGGSHQDVDGTSHTWSNSVDISADVDLGAGLDTATGLGDDAAGT